MHAIKKEILKNSGFMKRKSNLVNGDVIDDEEDGTYSGGTKKKKYN